MTQQTPAAASTTPTASTTNSAAASTKPVKAILYTVEDPIDRPVSTLIQNEQSFEVQFNPASLKVSLANSLKENERSGSSRAAQYVDSSSSNLTVELIFDTTQIESNESPDVRVKTGQIANLFMKTEDDSDEQVPPQKCLFLWGSFAFVGIMESFDETLDFFSSEGVPLRSTISLKLSESRFQFRTEEAKKANTTTPKLSPLPPGKTVANNDDHNKDWREEALYNGIESVRNTAQKTIAKPGSNQKDPGLGEALGQGIPGFDDTNSEPIANNNGSAPTPPSPVEA